jgi:hypothetical protein
MIDDAELKAYAAQCAAVIQDQAVDLGSRQQAQFFMVEVCSPLLAAQVGNLQHMEKLTIDDAIDQVLNAIRVRFEMLRAEVEAHQNDKRH